MKRLRAAAVVAGAGLVLGMITSGILGILGAALTGCTSTVMIDLSNRDMFSYRTHPWYNQQQERAAEAEARVRHYCRGARTQYPTNSAHRVEVRFYGDSTDTNLVKKAVYVFKGEKEGI